jgi:hypothetical protein
MRVWRGQWVWRDMMVSPAEAVIQMSGVSMRWATHLCTDCRNVTVWSSPLVRTT